MTSGRVLGIFLVLLATIAAHYENPWTDGCAADEQRERGSAFGIAGEFCAPLASGFHMCPRDQPPGVDGLPQAVFTQGGNTYCANTCGNFGGDCGKVASCEYLQGYSYGICTYQKPAPTPAPTPPPKYACDQQTGQCQAAKTGTSAEQCVNTCKAHPTTYKCDTATGQCLPSAQSTQNASQCTDSCKCEVPHNCGQLNGTYACGVKIDGCNVCDACCFFFPLPQDNCAECVHTAPPQGCGLPNGLPNATHHM